MEEAELVRLFQQEGSKRDTFAKLVQQYQQKVYGIVRKMVVNHEDADDVVQEVFVKVWHNLDKFKGESGLFTWIYRIATNESLQFLRKKRRRMFFSADITEVLINNLTSEVHLDGNEIQLKLQKAILQLPDKQRLVFNLKYYEGLKYEQIAEITDSSIGSLKASYHHATKKIEEYLQRD
ncbi:sigma-70 family RNA polymerase sigma factor [Fulvivirga sp. 29W222]|uniref:RNA polymerase sigma factor n=1 Tax=Fulvivirga marina TaxID=2494733 RepID=A0A937FXV2_9BACT|nr:sigma-70 family RNA polymerase sigma factor [Fulvivirga marina]